MAHSAQHRAALACHLVVLLPPSAPLNTLALVDVSLQATPEFAADGQSSARIVVAIAVEDV